MVMIEMHNKHCLRAEKLVVIAFMLLMFSQQPLLASGSYKNISCYEVKRQLEIDSTIFVLDVRTSIEYYEGHIQGAININVYYLWENHSSLPAEKTRAIIVYCDNGFRSKTAAEKLDNYGYMNVSNMERGFNEWMKLGYPYVVGSGTNLTSTIMPWSVFTAPGLLTVVFIFGVVIIWRRRACFSTRK